MREESPESKVVLGRRSMFSRSILVINWECSLIPVIVFANRRRHLQGWHSNVPRLRRHPEFADIQHHRPTELRDRRKRTDRKISNQRSGPEVRDSETYDVAGNYAEATKGKSG